MKFAALCGCYDGKLPLARPGRGCRSEVHMRCRVTSKPAPHSRSLVGPVVIDDRMDVEIARHTRVNLWRNSQAPGHHFVFRPPRAFQDNRRTRRQRLRRFSRTHPETQLLPFGISQSQFRLRLASHPSLRLVRTIREATGEKINSTNL